MAKNKFKESEEEPKIVMSEESIPSPPKSDLNRNKERRKKIRGMIDGSILLQEGLVDHWRFIVYCFSLALLLIASNYFAESTIREITKMKREMKELRTRELSSKSELMSKSIQSSVAKALDSTGVKESLVPPIKIVITSEDKVEDGSR